MSQKDNELLKTAEFKKVLGVEEFFDELSKDSKVGFFQTFLNKVNSRILKLFEYFIEVRLFIAPQDTEKEKMPLQVKKLMEVLFKQKIIKNIMELENYNDEPKIFCFVSVLEDTSTFFDAKMSVESSLSADSDRDTAIIKSVCEAAERFSAGFYKEKKFIKTSYNKVSSKAINPLSFVGISENQRNESGVGKGLNQKFKIKETSVFNWIRGKSIDGKNVLIPAQLVYCPYNFRHYPEEPIILLPITTGIAAGQSFEDALYRGICESVERDAFMITWLNKLSPPVIDLNSIEDEEMKKIVESAKRYNLEIYAIDMTTDIKIPSVLSVIIDRTGIGPAVMVSAKTSLNLKEAIVGAIQEGLSGRIVRRSKIARSPDSIKLRADYFLENPSEIKTFHDRMIYWTKTDMIEKIEFLLKGQRKKITSTELFNYIASSDGERVNIVLDTIKNNGLNGYWIDITYPAFKKSGLRVVKFISPELHPLNMTERIKYLGGDRLYSVPVSMGYYKKPLLPEELNSVPHPFP